MMTTTRTTNSRHAWVEVVPWFCCVYYMFSCYVYVLSPLRIHTSHYLLLDSLRDFSLQRVIVHLILQLSTIQDHKVLGRACFTPSTKISTFSS
jgi:hypothetical protein